MIVCYVADDCTPATETLSQNMLGCPTLIMVSSQGFLLSRALLFGFTRSNQALNSLHDLPVVLQTYNNTTFLETRDTLVQRLALQPASALEVVYGLHVPFLCWFHTGKAARAAPLYNSPFQQLASPST